jgi:hypothetical protein
MTERDFNAKAQREQRHAKARKGRGIGMFVDHRINIKNRKG